MGETRQPSRKERLPYSRFVHIYEPDRQKLSSYKILCISPPSGGRFATRSYIIHSVLRESEVITRMSEKEKKIIETIAEALPNMSERDKGYFLGYAEAKADKTPADREQEKEEEVS